MPTARKTKHGIYYQYILEAMTQLLSGKDEYTFSSEVDIIDVEKLGDIENQ